MARSLSSIETGLKRLKRLKVVITLIFLSLLLLPTYQSPLILCKLTDSSLPPDQYEKLTMALNEISDGGDHQWDQEAVNSANQILSDPSYSSLEWEEFFHQYFDQNPFFTDGLRSYIGYPVFAWFSEQSHRNLQRGLISPLIRLVEQFMLKHHENLSDVLDHNPKLLQTLMNSHRFLAMLAWGGGWSQGSLLAETERVQIYNFYKAHISNYSNIWKNTITFNPAYQPYLSTVRAQIWMNLRDTLPLTNDLKLEIAEVIGIEERYLEIWNDFSVLVIDNNGLDDTQLSVIYDFLIRIPSELHNLGSITVKDFMEVPDKRHLWFITEMSINIFGSKVGEFAENQFPHDIEPRYSDVFSIVLAHELNHVVDAHYVSKNDTLCDRKENLIGRAGNTSMNYLRSMFAPDFFTNAPQEFFASISNQWFSDAFHTLELGLTRFSNGYLEPINQFLFFAEVYSLGLDQTIFYTTDTNENITRNYVPVKRDANHHINSLDYNGMRYLFNLDDEGNVLEWEKTRIVSSTDLNSDGTINIVDISIVAVAFGTIEGDENYNPIADLDDNKQINIVDVSIVALDYGKTV